LAAIPVKEPVSPEIKTFPSLSTAQLRASSTSAPPKYVLL